MVKNGVDTPQKVEDLAKALGMDPVLLGRWSLLILMHGSRAVQPLTSLCAGRLMRHVCAMGHLDEVAQDEYKLTNFAKSLSLDVIGDSYVVL
jgi:hypothetical protein